MQNKIRSTTIFIQNISTVELFDDRVQVSMNNGRLLVVDPALHGPLYHSMVNANTKFDMIQYKEKDKSNN